MQKLKDPVRVEVNGGQVTVSRRYAEAKGLKILAKERAVDKSGRVLSASGHSSADRVGASIDGDVADLKGAALTQALEDAGLPKGGNADEKRARLTEARAAAANLTDQPPGGSEDNTEGVEQ